MFFRFFLISLEDNVLFFFFYLISKFVISRLEYFNVEIIIIVNEVSFLLIEDYEIK